MIDASFHKPERIISNISPQNISNATPAGRQIKHIIKPKTKPTIAQRVNKNFNPSTPDSRRKITAKIIPTVRIINPQDQK